MKYALVNGQRQEAQPSRTGECPACGSPMVARCGEIKVWHWAHRGRRTCDQWWENETDWHRNWKGQFPDDWQEIVLKATSGEKHIADVRTQQGWILEFQHSYIKPEERESREEFYGRMAWVVDGTRRQRDKRYFFEELEVGILIHKKPWIWRVGLDNRALLRDWASSRVPVCFDFSTHEEPEAQTLWCLLPWRREKMGYIVAFSREGFIHLHTAETNNQEQNFLGILKELRETISRPRQRVPAKTALRPVRLRRTLPRRRFRRL